MPLPRITDDLIASSQPVKEGWSLFELVGIRSMATADGTSLNHFFDFMGMSGPGNSAENSKRKFAFMVNSKGLDAGIPEVIGPYIQCLTALVKADVAELKNVDLEESKLVGKRVWAEVFNDIVDGKTYKKVRAFSPEDVIPF
jgi:hypothetical protein